MAKAPSGSWNPRTFFAAHSRFQALSDRHASRHKVGIARKESFETRYWLRLVAYADKRSQAGTEPLIRESSELIAILTTIRKNAERNPDRGAT
jgi:hypothetical protein